MSELNQLETLLTQGKITRREFIRQASALGIAASVSPALLTLPAEAATPKKGGRFRIGVPDGSVSDSLDPVQLPGMMRDVIIFGQLYNCLVEINYKGDAVPELAETWESSPDAKKWFFRLRKGVEFHNGKTLDAEDVIFSINRHRGENSKSASKGILKPVSDVKADGKHTVIFTLKSGNVDFPYILSEHHLGITPAGTTDFEKGTGTAGYKLIRFKPGVRCLTRRNPNYWKPGRAHFDEVETLHIPDVTARVNALQTGDVDYIVQCDCKTAGLLKKIPDIQLISKTGRAHATLVTLTDVPPYDNNDVRLALKYAMDREEMVKLLLQGHGSVGNDHPITPDMRFFDSDLEQRTCDPDRSRYIMKKAGLAGYTFRFHVANLFPWAVDMAVLYKEQAAKAGINIEVMRESNDGYWSNAWMKKPWCMSFWYGRPTEDMIFSTVYAENSPWNETRFRHRRFNFLLESARSEFDNTKRKEIYAEMQRILRDEGGSIVPFFINIIDGAVKRLKFKDFATNLAGLDGFKAAERMWFES